MAAVIHKQVLPLDRDNFTIEVPASATVLSVHVQYGVPCIWYHVGNAYDFESKVLRFTWVGTGHHCHTHSADYVGTVLLEEGRLVLHLFKEG